MLEPWLSPVDTKNSIDPSRYPAHALYHSIQIYETQLPDISQVRLAIIGVEPEAADAIRRAWYPLAQTSFHQSVVDLGNVRNPNMSFLIPLMKELIVSGVIPVLIGADSNYLPALYAAFLEVVSEINLVVVDERVALSSPPEHGASDTYLNDIVYHPTYPPFHMGVIGYQIHQTPEAAQSVLSQRNFSAVRLGYARAQAEELEPVIRDADLVGFHLSAIRAADCPAVSSPTPSGFSSEEACQIARYAGMSDKLKMYGILGYQPGKDNQQLTAQVVAQMLWYFTDGVAHRKQDFPVSTEGLTEYVVDLKDLNHTLTFWKSKRSGRWWMQIPVKTRARHQRHRLVPCSYEDYKKATRDEMPDRLLQALRRFP